MRSLRHTYSGRTVLVTGHTGFKGAWLCEWLLQLGARVVGFALESPTHPSLFGQLGLAGRMESRHGDVRDQAAVTHCLDDVRPDFVFHLAAQSLVRGSYREPVLTCAVNLMGTIHVLDALRTLDRPCTAVMVTTDKCYRNREWAFGYRETDELGGRDPYSASKAMAELAVAAWQQSWFLQESRPRIRVASARAGNVIGGGDWAEDRIVPDSVRALAEQRSIAVRNPDSCRPWQHVLDPLHGYLRLAESLNAASEPEPLRALCSAFNFGPPPEACRPVRDLVQEITKQWPGVWHVAADAAAPHEAALLSLCTDKARSQLGWAAELDFSSSVRQTVAWYQAVHAGQAPLQLTQLQIKQFMAAVEDQRVTQPVQERP